ncbi:hypothetical protein GWI34_26735 [Actinomadura sp. DSM 109109]|nr:hypothetical protein [Actinomadura lepetitiana]
MAAGNENQKSDAELLEELGNAAQTMDAPPPYVVDEVIQLGHTLGDDKQA